MFNLKKLLLVLWLPLGVLNWGLTLGDFTHCAPYMPHEGVSAAMAVIGPFATPTVLLFGFPRYHILWKPKTSEERWAEFQKEGFGTLGRDYFDQNYN